MCRIPFSKINILMTARFDKYFFSLFSEETFDNLFRNPEHNDANLEDILVKFENNGGEILGDGAFATALSHPKWNYVLKIFKEDDAYLTYARYCFRNQNNPCVPKFLDKPRKIIPNFTRKWLDERELYYVRMEKLEPFRPEYNEFRRSFYPYVVEPLMRKYSSKEELMTADLESLRNEYSGLTLKNIIDAITLYRENIAEKPWIYDYWKLMADIETINKRLGTTMDLHTGNVMIRESDGVLVVTDPLAYAMNRNKSKDEIRDEARRTLNNRHEILTLRGGQNRSKNKILKTLRK